ncbi:protein 4.1 homolog isoform X2 [Condylostylus longicornis]|uniref:protein 4.1 homolog isoform X2 n=1 Tax=Condylostylus longicornis TaxID=2530218 RepID=UPI00244DA279|nr:protein 4.1 homolog isoform X2 [Condylostylus longicornis]
MPAETKSPTSVGHQPVTETPSKKKSVSSSSSSGKAALARVTLLDGSILDVTIDRKAKGRDLLNSICAGLNILEKDYFGLIYSTPNDPRCWLDLERPVAKFFKTDPWVLQFAVKFYPPEPSQLQEDITRYHLCLQVRNDILEGRLPGSFVTYALLGSYLVQSEMGDWDIREHNDRRYLRDFKIAPEQTSELLDKVIDLHKTHKGQSPAEAELHYLENAKKLTMYGVDLHPAKDSEGVDIMLGVCASGVIVYRDKMKINRFAWPKILKLSYKRHHFYIKIRPGEFEQYESTIGFKLANHRAAKKLWKSCVEHHTFFRLKTPEPTNKSTLFPRLGSKFRYSGRTMYEARKNPVDRPTPTFDRSLSGRKLASKSMDALALQEQEKEREAAKKRHTMNNPPEHIPDLDSPRSRSPLKKDKKEKVPSGAVSVLPTEKSKKEKEKKDKEKKEKEKPEKILAGAVNGNETDPNDSGKSDEKSPGKGFGRGGIFSSGRKSPKDKKEKEEKERREKEEKERKERERKEKEREEKERKEKERKEKEQKDKEKKDKDKKQKIAIAVTVPEIPDVEIRKSDKDKTFIGGNEKAGHTRPYEYNETEQDLSPTRKKYISGGFRYDEDPSARNSQNQDNAEDQQLSPNSRKRIGLAFNYAPGDDDRLKEQADKLKHGQLSPRTKEKLDKGQLSPKTRERLLKDGNLSPRTKQKLMTPVSQLPENATPLKDVHGQSYNPNSGRQGYMSGAPGTYKPIDDASTAFLNAERGGVLPPDVKPVVAGAVKPPLAAAAASKPKKKRVKIMVIISRFDPQTKRVDTENGTVEHSTGILDPETGLIETKYGVVDPKRGTLEALNTSTGQKQLYKGVLDPKTGNIHLTEGVASPQTGIIDDYLGQVIAIAPQDNPIVELTVITSRIDPNTKKVDIVNGEVERSLGVLDLETGIIDTKYGEINPKTGEVKTIDPKTNKLVTMKNASVDPTTGQIVISGVTDPKSGKLDPSMGRLVEVGQQIDPVVEVATISGKLDSKKGVIEPKTAQVETSIGQFEPKSGKVDTKYGQIDLVKHTITFIDPKTGKSTVKDVKIDPSTGQIVLKNQINPKNNKPDKDYGRIVSLRIVQNRVDPKTNKPVEKPKEDKDIIVDPKTNQIWIATGTKDPNSKENLYTSSAVDPKTGYVITIYGYLDPKTNEIKKQIKVDPNLIRVEPDSGKVYTATGDVDPNTGEPLYATTQVDPDSGEIYTKVGKVDPKTGRIILVKIFLVTKTDERGRPQEIDPQTCDIDPITGRINKIFNKTVYVYNMVDPITGEIIQVDPNDPRIAGARTTVTQTMTLSGEIDPVTGRIKTEYGHIDPNTGDIDPETAVKDPVTGKLILNYAQIDPSHFGKEVTVTKETVPITRDQFFEGIKHMGKNALRRDSEGSSDDDMTAQYGTENIKEMQSGTPKAYGKQTTTTTPSSIVNKFAGTPTVVKTTTKQILTKNEDGVTHNVEEEVRNLGTGEVTISTQEHKADPARDDTKASGAFITATAVTTRTATTHEDLGKKAKTEQLEEKTVATTRTRDPLDPRKQEQRVVTQEVKTTATVTSGGDQYQRRDSISSTSSGDSGTPIDGPYDGTIITYQQTDTAVPHVEQRRVILGEETPKYSATGEIVSSQTVSSKTRTVETITYKTERDGIVETRVEQKITIQSDGDPIDHDKALAEAIQEATAMNPDMTVEKIEIQQQTQ